MSWARSTLLAVGAVHLEQLIVAGFWSVPWIGPLFALNFAGSVAVAVGLLVPVGSVMDRWEPLVPRLLAVLGVAIAAGGLVVLLISESVAIFGFKETGTRPEVITAVASDAAAIVFLVSFLATPLSRHIWVGHE